MRLSDVKDKFLADQIRYSLQRIIEYEEELKRRGYYSYFINAELRKPIYSGTGYMIPPAAQEVKASYLEYNCYKTEVIRL